MKAIRVPKEEMECIHDILFRECDHCKDEAPKEDAYIYIGGADDLNNALLMLLEEMKSQPLSPPKRKTRRIQKTSKGKK